LAIEASDMQPATILVVDDTADILALTSSVLENAGYAVLRCNGSQQALAVLRDGHDIDLMLTDIAMPGIDGFELARQARVARPLLPIAYLTGHPHLSDGNGAALGPILKKPYRPDGLAREVEELLAPGEDARLVRAVALDMLRRDRDALANAQEAEQIDRAKGDRLSAEAWHDIAAAIAVLAEDPENTRPKTPRT
jgi:CheY-like chemotaxis protein